MTNVHSEENLGPWSSAELGKTAGENAGIGADDDLPLEVRFVSNVAKLVRRRRAEDAGGTDPKIPAVFLLHATPPETTAVQTKQVPMLDNGNTSVTGRLWFVSAVVVAGHYHELTQSDDEQLFRFITDDLSFGDLPAVIFDPRPKVAEIRFYSRGLREPESCHKTQLDGTPPRADLIFASIHRVYEACLVTPDAQPKAAKLWANSRKWWASSNAEDIVQVSLKAGLVNAFPTCTVRHEQPMPAGRSDLEIEESEALDRSKITRHAILELKVLRSFSHKGTAYSDAKIKEWIKSGVLQASEYRKDKGARLAFLCCFDMRKMNTGVACFKHVASLAKKKKVLLGNWFLYATARLRDTARSN